MGDIFYRKLHKQTPYLVKIIYTIFLTMKFLSVMMLASLTFIAAENGCDKLEELCSKIDWLKAEYHKATGYKSEAECKAKIEDFKIGQYAHIPAVVEASCYTWYAMLDKKVQEVLRPPQPKPVPV